MIQWIIYIMVFGGSALMIYNIYGFIRFALSVKKMKGWHERTAILYIPIILLIFFFLGYLGIGLFGSPDILVAAILFGGSIFVFLMYILVKNITKRISENEKLEAELQAAEASSHAKSSFLATMSHEMRTPMNVILGNAQLLQKRTDLADDARENVQKIKRSGEHLLQMINNILDMNSIETGEMEVENDNFSMELLLERVNDVAEAMCEPKNLTYEHSISDSVKGCYHGDKSKIEQILLAILNNAAKYTSAPGTVSFTAESVVFEENPNSIRFTIADTGVGIDPEFLPKIFELFTQEDASFTNAFGGSGIGLAATKQKVDLLGGKIEVESKKNVGTKFIVTIPLSVNALADGIISLNNAEFMQDDPENAISLEGKRILIVEDMEENAELVADLLELEGAESEHAENGKIAVEMFSSSEAHYYDAILMDLRMPVLDGWEAAKQIRALMHPDAKTVPILALTANAFESDVEQSKSVGMNEHLVKPVEADVLYSALKHYIKAAQQ